VMRSLSEMEHKLQSELRTQQQAVETSHLACDGTDPSPAAWPASKTINEVTRANATGVSGRAPITDHEAELAVGDLRDSTAEDDGFERGAKRRPAVNSEILPLPWSGRLGYVSISNEQSLRCGRSFGRLCGAKR
jgi:UV DNA damage endonuclease